MPVKMYNSSRFFNILKKLLNKVSMIPLNKKVLCIRLLLISFILLGGGLRLFELTSRPFVADEGISTMAAIDIYKTGYPPTTPGDVVYWRSVFHTSSMAIFFQFLGISVFVARLPSVIAGTLTILLIYYFGKELMNWKVGLIAAFLLSVNTLAIDLSREARMYAFFQFFYLLSLYFFYKGFEVKEGKTLRLFNDRIKIENIRPFYIVSSFGVFLISFLCHQGTAVLILGIIGYAVVMSVILRKKDPTSVVYLDKYLLLLLLSIIIIIAGILMITLTDYGQKFPSLTSYLSINLGAIKTSIVYNGFYFIQNFPIEWCFATLGLFLILRNRRKNEFFLMLSFLVPLVFQLLFFHFTFIGYKYIFHLIPLFIILSAYGIYEVARYLRAFEYLRVHLNIIPRLFCIFLCVLIIFAGFSYAYFSTHRGKMASPYWREACEYVLINSKNDTSLIASVGIIPYFFLESDEYGLRPEYPEYAHKNITIYDRPYLHTREDLENFTRTHDNGWILIDMDRWNWEEVITEDAKMYLQENMTYHPYKYHGYLFIYSWGYD
ncbi:MAG: glycosyltransferase family 39 protein [Thermoplasmata archaeon]|nr:MAG: glycosyltransferase family 39 protein [Thermoplasmata archaeon]